MSPPDPFVRRRTLSLLDRQAWRAFVVRWGVSAASLASGLATLFVFRRGLPHVGWIVGYVVVLWLLFTVLTQVRASLLARGRRRVVSAGNYTIQTLYHGLLLFVVPGYFASTTFDGPTAPFFLALVAAVLLTTVDPWYGALVEPHPWLGSALFAFALFAGLNVALPLVGLPPSAALRWSGALAALAVTPAYAARAGSWPRAGLSTGLSVTGAVLLAWLLTPAIPPVPLHLVRATIARDVVDLEPVDRVTRASWAALGQSGLVAYTPVAAPVGLEQPITHLWRHAGRTVASVRLPAPIRGGRLAGFRTFSRLTDVPAGALGRWTVDVVTGSGQLVGRLRFTLDP